MKLASGIIYCGALCHFAYVVEWRGVCLCRIKAPLSPLPSTPRPDGVSLGLLMNIDARGRG